jgi:hypothetical protein
LQPTDIEKKSLEAHVDLCAQRYRFLENKLADVDSKIGSLSTVVREVHDMVHRMTEKRNDQIITWGVGIIGVLVSSVIWLTFQYVLK